MRRAEPGLHVFVAGIEIVRVLHAIDQVVVAQVHRGRVGRPEPHAQLGVRLPVALRTSSDVGCDCQKLPQPHAEAARDIAGEDQARCAMARGGIQPAAFAVDALLHREAVGGRLHQFVIVPHRPIVQQFLAGGVEALRGWAVACPRVDRRKRWCALPGSHQHATAGGGLHGFGPEPFAFAGETHVPVVDLLAHRHGERDAEAADEILLFVAIEDDGVNQRGCFRGPRRSRAAP